MSSDLGFPDRYNAAEDLLTRNAGRADDVVCIDAEGPHTYGELTSRAGRFAALLAREGIAPEQRVALCLTDTFDFPACFLGALQHGAVPVPLNTRLTTKDYRYMLADCRARALVVSPSLLPTIEGALTSSVEHVFVTGAGAAGQTSLADALEPASPERRFADTREGDMAFWLYTSGTTGHPKGVVHAHRHLVETADLYATPTLGIGPDDVVFSAAKLFFAYGLGNALTFPMAVGAQAVLLEGPPTPEAVATIFREHGPTIFFGVPTLFGMLLAQESLLPRKEDLRLRLCVSAGEALPPELSRRWKERTGIDILDGLGSTEALHIFLSNRVGAIRAGSSGVPVDGYSLRLVGDDNVELEGEALGNLEVRGPTTAMMYWNRRDKTKATFRGEWMGTGDKYRRDADGYYYFEGRADDLMKVGGIWVSPFEVESTLLEHGAVLECAVVAHPDHDELIKPKAFVVLRDGHDASNALGDELAEFVRGRLASYKRPRWVEFVPELPRTATGKIQRFRLREA